MRAAEVRVAYLVSRFPAASETFVVRELNEVAEDGRIDVRLMSLFQSEDNFVHESAERWIGRVQRPTAAAAARASISWLGRRPWRLLSSVAIVIAASWRRPRILMRSLATLPLAAAHAAALREQEIDRVHAHFASYPALAAWLCWRLSDVPYSFTAHAYDIFVEQCLLRRKIADSAFVVAISRYNQRFLIRYRSGAEPPVIVVHCGVDPTAYHFRPRAPAAEGPVRALCVASLQEKKGHIYLLEALASGRSEMQRLSLDLVGGGQLRKELEARAEALGVASRVRFHGPRSETEVRELLDDTDLFVLPSIIASDGQMEGIPVALMEALACGVPAVATRLSGIPELVQDGVTGTIAEPADAASLAAALERVLGGSGPDPAGGRELVETEFDVRESGRRMTELFLESPGRSREP